MKKLFFALFLIFSVTSSLSSIAQSGPQWIRNLNTLPDTAFLYPVKTMIDLNNHIFVLSTYHKYIQPSGFINKIILNKYDATGNLLWNLDFDNGGLGKPRAFDMELDYSGNCYLAGAFMDSPNFTPLLMKVNGSGSVLWIRDSTVAFNTNLYKQIIYKNDYLYLNNDLGIAVFDNNGIEQWSEAMLPLRIAVDNAGRMLVSSYGTGSQTLFRYNINGTLDFSDSTIVADRIAVDFDNNIYLLAQWSNYNIAKHDSNGVFLWWQDNYPQNLSFGDQGFELLVDHYNDVLLVGLADSIYKLRPDGSMIWKQSMNGLDNYIIDAQIIYSNYLLVCGSIADTVTTGSTVHLYNLNGTVTWDANYRSNIQQDFPVSFAFGSDGVYVLADSISNTSLIKFESPFNNSTIDFDLFCVDSVWYDPTDSQFVNIRVVNGSLGGLNYPSVQMLSPTGDTISNPSNRVDFFVHIDNIALVYRDSILVQGITDFSDYSFLMSEGFGDTTAAIGWCSTTGVPQLELISIILYPNPARNYLTLLFKNEVKNCQIDIISQDGKVCLQKTLNSVRNENLDIENLTPGVYFIRIRNNDASVNLRFIKL